MLRVLPFVVQLALLVYCLIDCIQTDSVLVRNLPKPLWVFLIVILPVVGPVAWLVAGRPERAQRSGPVAWPSTATAGFPEYERPRPAAVDDDAALRAELRRVDEEHEAALRAWEDSLRARERRLRGSDDPEGTPQEA